MNSSPGRLRGSGIRTLSHERIPAMLERLKIRHHKTYRVESVRYRISGFRDPDTGGWISRNPRNGNYYLMADGRHRTKVRPTVELLSRSDMLALEVEIDRGKGARIYYTSIPGIR